MRLNKFKLGFSGSKGFSLVELIIVIAIMAALVAILVPSYISYVNKAKISVLENNMSGFYEMVSIYAVDYKKDKDWYGDCGEGEHNDSSLNNFIEMELEIINEGTPENNVELVNPYSGKKSVLDYFKTLDDGDGYCPAVFLTSTAAYAYDGGGSTNNIIGSIVVYFKAHENSEAEGEYITDYIMLYYVNKDGTKSEKTYTIT